MNKYVILVLGFLFMLGCSTEQNQTTQVINNQVTQIDQKVQEQTYNEVKEFNVKAQNFAFDPETITVNQGNKVIIHLTSLDDGSGNGHGLAIPAYNINVKLRKDETKTIEFIADKKGNFPFFCNVFCGQGHGQMKGQLIVE